MFSINKGTKTIYKNEKSTFHGKLTFPWNNSYQNLKHDRGNSLAYGSIKYLFDIMSALYILNLYYKDEVYELDNGGSKTVNFPINLGSELFAIKLHKWFHYDAQHNYGKKEDFDECLYLTKYTDDSLKKNKVATADAMKIQQEMFLTHPKLLEYLESNKIQEYEGDNLIYDILGKEEYFNVIRNATQNQMKVLQKSEYEATLNKNSI